MNASSAKSSARRARGITIEEKPEVRKAGGVYYTPRYIVDYIVEQTAGKLLDEISGGTSYTSPDSPAAGMEKSGISCSSSPPIKTS